MTLVSNAVKGYHHLQHYLYQPENKNKFALALKDLSRTIFAGGSATNKAYNYSITNDKDKLIKDINDLCTRLFGKEQHDDVEAFLLLTSVARPFESYTDFEKSGSTLYCMSLVDTLKLQQMPIHQQKQVLENQLTEQRNKLKNLEDTQRQEFNNLTWPHMDKIKEIYDDLQGRTINNASNKALKDRLLPVLKLYIDQNLDYLKNKSVLTEPALNNIGVSVDTLRKIITASEDSQYAKNGREIQNLKIQIELLENHLAFVKKILTKEALQEDIQELKNAIQQLTDFKPIEIRWQHTAEVDTLLKTGRLTTGQRQFLSNYSNKNQDFIYKIDDHLNLFKDFQKHELDLINNIIKEFEQSPQLHPKHLERLKNELQVLEEQLEILNKPVEPPKIDTDPEKKVENELSLPPAPKKVSRLQRLFRTLGTTFTRLGNWLKQFFKNLFRTN